MTSIREHDHSHSNGHSHSDGNSHSDGQIAAWVGQQAITVPDVLRREEALRNGEFASRLPVRRTPQGRNVVRWIVQLVATEQLISAEAAARGLSPSMSPDPSKGVLQRPVLEMTTALELGGVLATVLASMPVAAAVRDSVTADVWPDPEDVRRYYDNNPDQFEVPESRVIDTSLDGRGQAQTAVRLGELPDRWEPLVFTAAVGTPVLVTPSTVITVREIRPGRVESFADAAEGIAAGLREHERDLRFADWVHRGHRHLVRLAPGYEHPGDPHHPDATHQH